MQGKTLLVFIAIPSSLEKNFSKLDFKLNFSIPLPVEINKDETFDVEKISEEMILSGMLRLISVKNIRDLSPETEKGKLKSGDILEEEDFYKVPPEWIDYYKSIVFLLKPEIFHEFSSAAIVKAANGEYDMALEINDILEGLFPNSPGILLNRALILENKAQEAQGNDGAGAEALEAEALAAYERTFSVKPVLPDTFFNAGYFFLGQKNFERAKECFSEYISLVKPDGENLPPGVTLEKIQQAEKIVQDISVQGLDDENFREAYLLINQGKDNEGLARIRDFIEKHPKVRNGWFILGWALRKLGRYNDALESFKKAIELGGTDSDTQNEIAICCMELGDLKTAQKELETALRKDPENLKIISNLGVLALKRGSIMEAKAFFRTVLELDPEDPLAKQYLKT